MDVLREEKKAGGDERREGDFERSNQSGLLHQSEIQTKHRVVST